MKIDFKNVKLRRIETKQERFFICKTFYFKYNEKKYFLENLKERQKEKIFLYNEDGDLIDK
jgi:hypothetical protein